MLESSDILGGSFDSEGERGASPSPNGRTSIASFRSTGVDSESAQLFVEQDMRDLESFRKADGFQAGVICKGTTFFCDSDRVDMVTNCGYASKVSEVFEPTVKSLRCCLRLCCHRRTHNSRM